MEWFGTSLTEVDDAKMQHSYSIRCTNPLYGIQSLGISSDVRDASTLLAEPLFLERILTKVG